MRTLRLLPLTVVALVPAAVVQSPASEARSAADCSVRSTQLVPLTDLGRGRYRGQPGGLYPAGANRPPPRHLRRGLSAARRVRPVAGQVVLLSVGMSNAQQEFQGFVRLAQDGTLDPAVVLVNGAAGGWDAVRIAKPRSRYWAIVDTRLRQAGANRRQVQAVWLKEAIGGEDRPFPRDARALRAQLGTIVRILTSRFRNLRLVYVSSRTYGGYAITHLNPEPFAYQSGFAVKWLVRDAVRTPIAGRVWVGWGPYLWTDGTDGRHDGLVWACEDVQQDGTHPSASGVRKVARLLYEFFTTDPTARPWFTAP